MAKIIINRKGQYRNRLRGIKVLIDGQEVGSVKNDSSEEFTVSSGFHEVQCKIDWCSCKPLQVNVNEGEVKILKLESGMKYYNVLTIIAIVVIALGFIYPRIAHRDLPDWWYYGQFVYFGFVLLYLIYFLSIARDKYLSLNEDRSSIFNS